uniref:Uncharacterized protein n=1 Tax=Oryza sativa subsp. japonica TaxID=39947 RepID=Q8H307_ORYSJ|nr:hypothetical protein [Oryza sativa Japonica Group]
MTSPRGIGGADERAPPVGGSKEVGARWTQSTRALPVGAPRGSHVVATADGEDEVAPTWRHRGSNAGRHGEGHVDGPNPPGVNRAVTGEREPAHRPAGERWRAARWSPTATTGAAAQPGGSGGR